MWQVDKHVAKAMFDDRADLEVKQRGLPIPTPDPYEEINKSARVVPARPPLRRRLSALAYRWDLICRWLARLGHRTDCRPVATSGSGRQ
ncbi:MAG: hypothetical protein EHM56_13015 [Chloroflexi bacterium]|nr:MAG: hypothetical protein EHM56_13015 [Chloroflexota bacterium]